MPKSLFSDSSEVIKNEENQDTYFKFFEQLWGSITKLCTL